MVRALTALRLMQRLRARRSTPNRDWADCGTAFGLELSLEPQPEPAPPPPAAATSGWWRRFAPRNPATPT